ncbi:MAG: DUF72 domain-containing protein [Acidobacteria bacterium]|nr:DUF72 domain-containing protein [Acidobacteriota bacterium]
MKGCVYIGPAGWSYPDWEGVVYPPPIVRRRAQLGWIAAHFNLVEINTSFYRIPAIQIVRHWLASVAFRPDFRFSVKLFRNFTHARDLDPGAVTAVSSILEEIHHAGRLGCVLVQFPWSFKCVRQDKIYLHKLIRTFHHFPLALEIRHRSWDIPEFYRYLQEQKVAFCNIDQPVIGPSIPLTHHVTAPHAYLRLHGRNSKAWFAANAGRDERYNYLYDHHEIGELAETAAHMVERVDELYIVTNNHYRGKAVLNAGQLAERLLPGYTDNLGLKEEDVR